ncbi:hypothetical protein [Winogradskyella sp. SYSU M77433]|uniref:hypothetical protein n=1 Tax=Winogradskyella sp. SYSU M77433 TaxID=3042722 RepID=UPI00247FAF5A|nr:hypothetical protein [Winogradskyella sp. SYSU M77433]MDH7913602.1 hypothetical protein [Winogradskyella sp. SYSU M77433]
MLWFIGGIVFIFVLAFVIIKLTINTKENPDSNLGILEHPSTYKKPDIEMVDKSLEDLNFQKKD